MDINSESELEKQENPFLPLERESFSLEKGVAWPEPFQQNQFARSLRRRGRLIDPVKENLNTKMLKKYTKYVATAFAVASLSTFMIGCGGEATDESDPPPDESEDANIDESAEDDEGATGDGGDDGA